MMYTEFISYLLRDPLYISQAINLRISPVFFVGKTGFNEEEALYKIILLYYTKYHGSLTRDVLTRILSSNEQYLEPQKQEILFIFDAALEHSSTFPFDFTCDEIKKIYTQYHLQETLVSSSEKLASGKVSEVIPKLKQTVSYLEANLDNSIREGTIQKSVDGRLTVFKQAQATPEITKGIMIGFDTFDLVTHGIQKGELALVAASSGEGKSVMLLNAAHHVQTKLGKNVLFFSLENRMEQFERRYTSLDARIEYDKLKAARLTLDEERYYMESLQRQREYAGQLYIVDFPDPVCSANLISAKLIELKSRYVIDFIVVDYLHLMQLNNVMGRKAQRDHEYWGEIAKELRAVSRLHNIPILSAVQVNREGMKAKDYELEHIALSQFIVNHSDIILAIRVTDPVILESSGTAEFIAKILKNRDGAKRTFKLQSNFEMMSFTEII